MAKGGGFLPDLLNFPFLHYDILLLCSLASSLPFTAGPVQEWDAETWSVLHPTRGDTSPAPSTPKR